MVMFDLLALVLGLALAPGAEGEGPCAREAQRHNQAECAVASLRKLSVARRAVFLGVRVLWGALLLVRAYVSVSLPSSARAMAGAPRSWPTSAMLRVAVSAFWVMRFGFIEVPSSTVENQRDMAAGCLQHNKEEFVVVHVASCKKVC